MRPFSRGWSIGTFGDGALSRLAVSGRSHGRTEVAVAVDARWRHQSGEAVERGQEVLATAAGFRFRGVVDEVLAVEFAQPLLHAVDASGSARDSLRPAGAWWVAGSEFLSMRKGEIEVAIWGGESLNAGCAGTTQQPGSSMRACRGIASNPGDCVPR